MLSAVIIAISLDVSVFKSKVLKTDLNNRYTKQFAALDECTAHNQESS
jgi:hypothetical protein